MADDLDSFFAKKNAKKKQKKGGIAQNVDSLARKLERTVRQQEEFDREEEEFTQQQQLQQQQRQNNAPEQTGGQQNNEDSEWIEYRETDEIDLEGLPIKEMDLNDEEMSDGYDVEERSEPAKTWNIPQPKQDQEENKEPTEAEQQQQQQQQPTAAPKYIPPSKRMASSGGGGGTGVAPKLENEIEFPSLAAAATIDPEKDKKKRNAWSRPLAAANKPAASPSPTHSASPQPSADQQVPDEGQPMQMPAPGKYVPPHLRRQVQTPEISTENRYDRLGE